MRLRFWLGAALAVLLTVTGVQGIAHATGTTGNTERTNVERAGDLKNYKPDEYLDGIYFGIGPLADKLGKLHPDRTAEEIREMERLAKEARPLIEKDFPGFSKKFATALQSGDHIRTREMLTIGARLVGQAYTVLYPDQPPPGMCGEAKVCVVDIERVAFEGHGIALLLPVAVAVWRYLWMWDDDDDDDDDEMLQWRGDLGLYLDEITHVVVNVLGPMHH